MIQCQLIDQARGELRVAGETVELGRSTACQIPLPDHRVELVHAVLRRGADGVIRIEAERDALITIDGFPERSAIPTPGTRIGIGPYLLTAQAPTDGADIALAVETPPHDAAEATAPPLPVTLAALGIGKRRLGLLLAAFVFLGLFLLPLSSRLSPAFERWQAGQPASLTGMLNPGPVSRGHVAFGLECSACHRQAFQGVPDAACTECHTRVANHLAAGKQGTSNFGRARCADCHAGHQGKARATEHGTGRCLACHRGQAREIAAVRDFGERHPDFRLAVPQERSGLKFSHKVHLAKGGVSTPLGDTVMTCGDCHKLEESGRHFAPMEMERTCQQSRCHKLRFAEPISGAIPHGPERAATSLVRDFFLARLADDPTALRECAPAAKGRTPAQRLLDCADVATHRYAAAALFQQDGKALSCALCHEIAAAVGSEPPWKIAPVRIPRDWHATAIFDHARHDTMGCGECHDKTASTSSADVAMPNIAKCRECHGGTGGGARKVASSCGSCHTFHRFARDGS